METLITFLVIVVIVVIWLVAQSGNATIQARQSAQLVCPHCQTKGLVTTRHVKLKKGISGGKAVGALLTAGVSVLATGLSRKEDATEAKCSNCGSVWHF
jgi:DNA-directed RNA polymerase subunit RPC12/RpoP